MSTLIRTASLAFVLLLVMGGRGNADELDFLLQEFDVVQERVDDAGIAKQAALLERIADQATPRARKKLLGFRKRWAGMNWRRHVMLLSALVRRGGPEAIDDAIRWVEKTEKRRGGPPLIRWSMAKVLAGVKDEAARAHLREKALRRATPELRIQLIRSLALAQDQKAVPALIELLEEWHPETRLEAAIALGELGNATARKALTKELRDKDYRMRLFAVEALGRLGTHDAASAICKALEDKDPRVVEAAAIALGILGTSTCVQGLIDAMRRHLPDEFRTANACADVLECLSGKALGLDPTLWADWWDAVKDRPLVKNTCPLSERTVPGLPYYGFRLHSSRITFVLDVSKSMEWNERLESAKRELAKVVASLPKTTRFNIITFSDGVSPWQDRVEPADKKRIKKALKFLSNLAPQKGTNTHGALEQALFVPKDAKPSEVADTILFLSDGAPSAGRISDPEAILAQVREWNRYRRAKILCIALLTGKPPGAFRGQEDAERAERFMRRLAEENGGRIEVFR